LCSLKDHFLCWQPGILLSTIHFLMYHLVVFMFDSFHLLLASVRGLHLTKNAMGGRGEQPVRRINLGRLPVVVEPHPRELGAQARRLSLTPTMPLSNLAPTPYATGAALALVRRACPPPPCCPELPARSRVWSARSTHACRSRRHAGGRS